MIPNRRPPTRMRKFMRLVQAGLRFLRFRTASIPTRRKGKGMDHHEHLRSNSTGQSTAPTHELKGLISCLGSACPPPRCKNMATLGETLTDTLAVHVVNTLRADSIPFSVEICMGKETQSRSQFTYPTLRSLPLSLFPKLVPSLSFGRVLSCSSGVL